MMKIQKTKIDFRVLITIAVVIGAVEITAILNGLDGKLLTFVLAILAGLGGWVIPSPKFK